MPAARKFQQAGHRQPMACGRAALAAGLFSVLQGCAALLPSSAENQPIALPAEWSAAAPSASVASTSLVQWWERFNDPLLSTLVADALKSNTGVLSAQAALRQARALRDVSAAGLWPTLNASATAQRNQSGNNDASNSYRVGLDAGWEIDIFGGNRRALDVAEAGVRASAASLADVQVSIAAEVALGYIALRSGEARLAIAGTNLNSQLETQQLTQWRLQAGLVSSLDTEQARGAAEQTRAQLPALQTGVEQARHALAVLTGRPPAALAGTLSTAAPVPQAPDTLALSLPAETLRQRPDVRAAEQQVSAALARVAQAEAARLPSFRLSGSIGLNALALGALGDGGSVVRAFLASVSLPLFDGGAARAQVRAQAAALEQARAGYQSAVLTALKEVEDALVALRGDRERLARLQLAAEAATNAALMASQRYASGLIDFQTVLDTQRSQLNTQDSVAAAIATVSADHVRLYKALGGGWQPDGAPAGDPFNQPVATRTYRP